MLLSSSSAAAAADKRPSVTTAATTSTSGRGGLHHRRWRRRQRRGRPSVNHDHGRSRRRRTMRSRTASYDDRGAAAAAAASTVEDVENDTIPRRARRKKNCSSHPSSRTVRSSSSCRWTFTTTTTLMLLLSSLLSDPCAAWIVPSSMPITRTDVNALSPPAYSATSSSSSPGRHQQFGTTRARASSSSTIAAAAATVAEESITASSSCSSSSTDGRLEMFCHPTTASSRRKRHRIAVPHQPDGAASGAAYRWKHHHHHDDVLDAAGKRGRRGTLGFVIDAADDSSTALFSTRRRSNVDTSAWNGARALDWNDDDDSYKHGNNHDNDNHRNQNDDNDRPWKQASSPRSRLSLWNGVTTTTTNAVFAPSSYSVVDRLKEERADIDVVDWQRRLWHETQHDETHETTGHDVDDYEDEAMFQWLYQDADDRINATTTTKTKTDNDEDNTQKTVNSLAEWVRTVDLEPLLRRREEIHYQKRHGKRKSTANSNKNKNNKSSPVNNNTTREELVQSLTKLFSDSQHQQYSNYQVQQMYAAAKLADQQGQRDVSRQILEQLLEATPQDGRLYRRLARLHAEEGHVTAARAVLQRGLRRNADNPYLWHGLGGLADTAEEAAAYYRRAIRADAGFAHAHHALGTLQHSRGRIAAARQTLQRGVQHCPANHRLFHALGDLYREAKLLDLAETNYRKALRYGPPGSHGFAYTALAAVAYERGDQTDTARHWLVQATRLHHGRHANAWRDLAHLEEAVGNTQRARRVCQDALDRYERGLLARHHRHHHHGGGGGGMPTTQSPRHADQQPPPPQGEDPVAIKNAMLQNVPIYRSGDRFFQVYRTWARLEGRYGTLESAEKVYERATAAFPHNGKILLDWADLYVRLGLPDRARQVFSMACVRDATGEAYRRFAAFEMSRGGYDMARRILFRGALRLSEESLDPTQTLSRLYHLWAVCEWHLQDSERAEILLDHAMRLTAAGSEGAASRSSLLFTLATLQYCKGEYLLAQHCIALCWKENPHDDSAPRMWELWADVAAAMDNPSLQQQCLAQAERSAQDLNNVTKLLTKNPSGLQGMMRRGPWHYKIFEADKSKSSDSPFPYGVQLPKEDALEVTPLR